jgi:hypothetical protein
VRASANAVAASPVDRLLSACRVKENVSPGVVPDATNRCSAMGCLLDLEQAQLL